MIQLPVLSTTPHLSGSVRLRNGTSYSKSLVTLFLSGLSCPAGLVTGLFKGGGDGRGFDGHIPLKTTMW